MGVLELWTRVFQSFTSQTRTRVMTMLTWSVNFLGRGNQTHWSSPPCSLTPSSSPETPTHSLQRSHKRIYQEASRSPDLGHWKRKQKRSPPRAKTRPLFHQELRV